MATPVEPIREEVVSVEEAPQKDAPATLEVPREVAVPEPAKEELVVEPQQTDDQKAEEPALETPAAAPVVDEPAKEDPPIVNEPAKEDPAVDNVTTAVADLKVSEPEPDAAATEATAEDHPSETPEADQPQASAEVKEAPEAPEAPSQTVEGEGATATGMANDGPDAKAENEQETW